MRSLLRFFRLPSGDRWLLITSGALLAAIWLGLRLIPFHALRKFLGKMNRASGEKHETDQAVLSRIVWAVSTAGRRLPKAGNCLAQALATQLMLGRRGHEATLRIGVARSDDGEFRAHAWLETGGRIVIGGPHAPFRFVPLPPLKGEVR